MTPELPDDLYLRWLYSQVASVRFKNPSKTYWSLLRQLYITEFVWLIPNDDNRVEDGRQLRLEFIEEQEVDHVNEEWLNLGCSMLEMLIALSRRLAFASDGQSRAWFWHLLKNIELDQITDAQPYPEDEVTDILNNVIWRTYRTDGQGGLFPLQEPQQDQTRVELWYQISSYFLERGIYGG